jgi:hypothetical protein
VWKHRLHESGIAKKIDLDLPMRDFERNTFNRARLGDPSVIHQHIDPPASRYNVGYRLPDSCIIGHIEADGLDMAGAYLFQPVHAPGESEYIISVLGKKFCCCPADTTGSTGYQRDLVGHMFLPFMVAIPWAFYT